MARLPKPWYRAERKAWFVTINGVQHNLGPDKKAAHQRFHALMRHPKARRVSAMSLAAVIDEFLDWVQKNRSSANYEGYRYRLQRFVSYYPELRAEDVRPYHIEKWAGAYDISKTTRRNYLRAVKRCFRWAKQQGYVDENPIADLEVPAADCREVVIRRAEFDRLLSCCRDQTLRDVLVTAWETGCRPQELVKMTASHFDSANGRWVFKQSESKMKRVARIVYLGPESLNITKRLVAQHPVGQIFRNSYGRPWTMGAINSAMKRLRARMGKDELERTGGVTAAEIEAYLPKLNPIRMVKGKRVTKTERELRTEAKVKIQNQKAAQLAKGYCLYALRHSWATHALENGVDSLTVAVLMGHKDPSMLARVYQHLSHNPKHLLDQARKATASTAAD
ncbi:MAG: tyrosine-type recombinase/integrase [Pirellulales bacterium]